MRSSTATLVLAATLAAPGALTAQGGSPPENLQVLPSDLSRGEVFGIMRTMGRSLGVTCSYCHVREGGETIHASDDDPEKITARAMMRMVREINASLAELPNRSEPPIRVTCATCHGGIPRPRSLADELRVTLESSGPDEMEFRYRELRETFFGTAAYNFAEDELNVLAGALTGDELYEEALRVYRLNLDFHAGSADIWAGIGGVHERAGDDAAALEAYERALELDPDHRQVQRRLRALGGG